MQFTLKYLLESYKVMVPQIQRDYAQGREREFELRKGFVTKIKQTIQDNEPKLNLDFIYGFTEKAGKDEEVFIPLDGQQRLTTLWLTHWFLAPRFENKISDEAKAYLSKFTYETRVSSKRFCYNLIQQPLSVADDIALSQQITDAPWFMASWSSDPTVISMLNMLDTLQEEISDKSKAWQNLTNQEKVTFDFIDIKSDEFKLTDELYIKMNSRGKPLTPFENFKAQFSGLLASQKTDYTKSVRSYEKTSVSYQQYFAFKIDSVWMDLFWSYRTKTGNEIDNSIYRFINFIAEFLFFRGNPNSTSAEAKMDFEFLNAVFSKKENIDFLFDSLDFLSSLKDVNLFFEGIFYGVSTFDQYPKDYFVRAITDTGFDVKDKTILYTILCYCSKENYQTGDNELKDFIRVVRNLLFAVRQPNQSKRIEYTTNLRLPNVSEYCRFIDAFVNEIKELKKKSVYQILSEKDFGGFTKENIANEKIKASLIVQRPKLKASIHKLEEHTQLQGNIANFKLNTNNIEYKIDAFLTIWNNDDEGSLIIRALLTIDDYSVMTHSYSSLDEIWFFGCKDNWNRILTTSDKNERIKVSDTLDKFLIEFNTSKGATTNEKLQYLIDDYKPVEKDWRYYFVKYKAISKNPYRNLNVFTWQDSQGFDINHLGNSGNQPLHSYHLNPYLIVLQQSFSTNEKVKLFWGRFTELSLLRVEDKINIKSKSNGWQITPIENYAIDKKIINKYNLNQQGSDFWLIESANKDRIEIAVDLINDILK
ncbi:MAG: DUF262 domain-containing protein [Chitinophagaceae bacterium]